MRPSHTTQRIDYDVALTRPLTTSQGLIRRRRGHVVILRDGARVMGVGEAATVPWLSEVDPEQVREELNQALSIIDQWSPKGPEEVSAQVASMGWAAPTSHAMEQALLDRMARQAGVPMARLLNENSETTVRTHRLVQSSEEAMDASRDGTTCLKLKVGADAVDADIRRIRALRDQMGAEVKLRLDANGAWSLPEALQALSGFEGLGIDCVEEPLRDRDLHGMSTLRRNQTVPIAADESMRTATDLERILQAQAADVVVIKPMLVGGPLVAHRLARTAIEAGLRAYITTSLEAAVGRAGALHVAAATEGVDTCGLDTGHLLAEDVGRTPAVSGGCLHISNDAGLGDRCWEGLR